MKRLFYLALLIVLVVSSFVITAQNSYRKAVFFTHAHQDDAVYFCGVPMSDYVKDNSIKTIFILYSASDQGANTGIYSPDSKVGNTYPFYKARDYGLMKAVEFCSTNGNKPIDFAEEPIDVVVEGKTIRKWTYRNSVIYFLDLPNGDCCSLNMDGYPANGYQTLEKLRKGIIPSITSMNNQTYTWAEIRQVVRRIFLNETADIPLVEVYSADVNFKYNPNDHADHYMSSVLSLEAMKGLPNFSSKLHTDYHLSNLPANLDYDNIVKKSILFGAMASGIASKGYKVTRHLDWFDKEYIRSSKADSVLLSLPEQLSSK